MNRELTQERLKEVLYYSVISGKFYWKAPVSMCIKVGSIAGCLHPYGYIRIGLDTKEYMAHRLAFLYITGKFPDDEVDHINHDRSANMWINIRQVTRTENFQNRLLYSTNKSGHMGVSFHKGTNKWRARIQVNGVNKYLGIYSDINDAISVRKAAKKEHGFHKNHGDKN